MAAWSLLTRVLQTLEMLLLPPPEQLALHGAWHGAQQHSSTCRLAAPGSQEQRALQAFSGKWRLGTEMETGGKEYVGGRFDNVGSGLNSQHGGHAHVLSPV